MWRLFGGRIRVSALALAPAAALGHSVPTASCVRSKHDAAEHAKNEAERRKQYDEAMAWCKEGSHTAYAASVLLADDGQGPRLSLIHI